MVYPGYIVQSAQNETVASNAAGNTMPNISRLSSGPRIKSITYAGPTNQLHAVVRYICVPLSTGINAVAKEKATGKDNLELAHLRHGQYISMVRKAFRFYVSAVTKTKEK
jgi:hypothetical protein